MQPHTAAIILTLHNHHFYTPDTRSYTVRARSSNRGTKGPNQLVYNISISSESAREQRIEVSGDINFSTFQRCHATVDLIDEKGNRYRLRHDHSHVTTEEWSVDKKEIYRGEYKSADSKRRSSFSAHLHGERSATFSESGGFYERWELEVS